MRFSLATLLLLTLFAASLAAVWVGREPWVLDLSDYDAQSAKAKFPQRTDNHSSGESPDGKRSVWFDYPGVGMEPPKFTVYDNESKAILYSTTTDAFFCRFLSDDAILATHQNGQVALFRRRFPEWWWGHFYRPEVWASIALGVMLLLRAFRARRRKAAGSVQQ